MRSVVRSHQIPQFDCLGFLLHSGARVFPQRHTMDKVLGSWNIRGCGYIHDGSDLPLLARARGSSSGRGP